MIMDDLKEHKIYYSNETLHIHYFTKDDVIHGEYKSYYPNAKLKRVYDCHHRTISGRDLEYYEDGKLRIDRYVVKGSYNNYCKVYDEYGSLITHIIYHNTIKNSLFTYEFIAEYTNNVLSFYSINTHIENYLCEDNEYFKYPKYHIIYNVKPHDDTKINLWLADVTDDNVLHGKIDLSIINPLRSLQKRFRAHIYSTTLNELNYVIKINDLSKLILLYLITYRKN